jgi:hypothetical protein
MADIPLTLMHEVFVSLPLSEVAGVVSEDALAKDADGATWLTVRFLVHCDGGTNPYWHGRAQ